MPFRTRRTTPQRQRGTAAVVFVLLLTMVFAAGAFALDIAHVLLVRNELQNAADAAALSGAGQLFSAGSAAKPNWAGAEVASAAMTKLNSSDGTALNQSTVQTGFWNVTGTPAVMQSPTTPLLKLGPDDAPAVKVTVSREVGKNGGPVVLAFGGFVGLTETAVSASAVAVVAGPAGIGKGALFPVAITKCLYDKYWDSAKMQPKLDPATGKPYKFKIGSAYHYDVCSSGEWTSFLVDKNNVTTIRDLIANGNPSPLAIGDKIWIQPGTENTLFNEVPLNMDVLIPVVVQLDTHSFEPIVAFAAFHIDFGVGGSGKYIQGHFTDNYRVPAGATGIGPYYGAFIPPRLAR